MKFVSLPTTCDAEQYLGPDSDIRGVCWDSDGRRYVTTAHEQRVYINIGDWIIKEPDHSDKFYPIKNDLFWKRWRQG